MNTEKNSWATYLKSPVGQKLMTEERDWFDRNLEDVFGYNAVQICPYNFDALNKNRVSAKYKFSFATSEAEIQSDSDVFMVSPAELPLATRSLDLLVLIHVLESVDDPHAVLREAERVLISEGRLVICSFNPFGVWAMNRYFGNVNLPPNSDNWVALARLKDWCKLLELEIVGGQFLAFYPAVNSSKWKDKFSWVQTVGKRWWPTSGAVYCLTSIKRTVGMNLVKTKPWNRDPKFRKKSIPSVSSSLENKVE
jgi:SAM-dependent methyltransferase